MIDETSQQDNAKATYSPAQRQMYSSWNFVDNMSRYDMSMNDIKMYLLLLGSRNNFILGNGWSEFTFGFLQEVAGMGLRETETSLAKLRSMGVIEIADGSLKFVDGIGVVFEYRLIKSLQSGVFGDRGAK